MKKKRKSIWKFFLVISLALILLSVFSVIVINANLDKNIDLTLLRPGTTSITRIYYYDKDIYGNPVGEARELTEEQIFLGKSEWRSYYDMPSDLVNAFIAVEDHRFYKHNGVDWLRTLKAAANYIIKLGKTEFGGSTITQQLVKNITGDNRQTPKRKIEEIIRALNIEKHAGKHQILEMYLNIVYLSQNCYGICSASRTYFGKEPEELTLAECASLASIVKSPTKYDPYKYPENNYKRRKIVLSEMLEHGMINEEEYNIALSEELKINSNIEQENNSGIFSWYTEALIDDITNDLMLQYNLSHEGANMLLYKGGLKIYSPIEPNVQKIAEQVFRGYQAYLDIQNGEYPQASCVVINPYTGDIVALVGGTGEKEGNRILNRATNIKRPLGSVIKPLSVYAPAIERGILSYSTVFDDVPILTEDGPWPKNSPDVYHGLTDLEYAVSRSLNTYSVLGLRALGVDNSFNFLKNELGFVNLTNDDKNEAPLALGQLTNGESLRTVTSSYAMMQNGGYVSNARTYYKVTDSFGNNILENEKNYKKVISEETASVMNNLLSSVTREGTARNTIIKNVLPVAGKTGTTGNSYDKWFVGYTPYYVCGVWVGFDTPQSIVQNGKSPAVTLFDAIMSEAHKNKNTDVLLFSSGNVIKVQYCRDSGKLVCDNCRLDPRLNRINTGYFIKGTEPTDICHLHKKIYIDPLTGMLSNDNTSQFIRRKIALLDYSRALNLTDIEILDERFTIRSRTR
ncbi:MAG: transglycosylase domain-containing protein [Clostridia bacterium]|nr:transglycosylase domain-containing protein [Clostridia bacterium]